MILSGGSGTRLWPLSRGAYPKQFLSLHGTDSLLAATVRRICRLENSQSAIQILPLRLICNDSHRFLVAEQIRLTGYDVASILLEPFTRNTAPPLTFAALLALNDGLDPVLVVLPSDHVILDESRFREFVVHGAELAEEHHVITFGIIPTYAETGFGYLRKGAVIDALSAVLAAFIEKPDQEKAHRLVQSGDYLWNSGIFMMKASVWIQETRKHCPAVLTVCEDALTKGKADGLFFRIDPKSFERCPNISI
ncbi:MAG: mannose-1-phosphate guanylyltransferase, partial [Methylococcales bacterium]